MIETLQGMATSIVGRAGAVLDKDENILRPTPEMTDEILIGLLKKAQRQVDVYTEEANRRGLAYNG